MKTTKTVSFRLDPSNPLRMTLEQKQALRDLGDEAIDYSDIPPQTGGGWRHVSEQVPAENKQQITLRFDADVIAFFRGTGRRSQSRIDAALREYVNAQKKVR